MAEETLQIKKKHVIILALALIVVIGAVFFVFNSGDKSASKVINTNNENENTNNENENTNNENLRIAEISLPGMFCAGCAQGSQNAFENMNGVVSAEVSINTKKGIVVYDSTQLTAEQLVNNGLIQAYDGEIISDKKYNGE